MLSKTLSHMKGYYFWKSILTRRLSKCVLICDSDTLKCTRIINIKIRKRKIARITGFNPKDYEYTRGKKDSWLRKGVF